MFVENAYELLTSGKGPGNDFLGWVNLPENYDKEEFARIKVAAEKIKKSCDVFIVIGMFNGGMDDVLYKAINICTECIGLG